MDYGKHRFEQKKHQKLNKQKQHRLHITKEIKIRPVIGKHDLEIKLNYTRCFLELGNKVKIIVIFRGREIAHMEQGRSILLKLASDINNEGVIEAGPAVEGKTMYMIIGPGLKEKKVKKNVQIEE